MRIAGQHVAINNTVVLSVYTRAAHYTVSEAYPWIKIFQRRVVELMTGYYRVGFWLHLAPGVMVGFLQANIAASLGPFMHHRIGRDHPDHVRLAALPLQAAAQGPDRG